LKNYISYKLCDRPRRINSDISVQIVHLYKILHIKTYCWLVKAPGSCCLIEYNTQKQRL